MRKGAHGNVAIAVKEETKVEIFIFVGKGKLFEKSFPFPYAPILSKTFE